MRWSEPELPDVVAKMLATLGEHGILESIDGGNAWQRPAPTSPRAIQLSLLAQATIQTIERYYLAIALLMRAGSGQINARTLADRCQLMAQRMTMIYGFNSPEFSDRTMFENFVDLLLARGVLRAEKGGLLAFDEVLTRTAEDAEIVLSEQLRHSILQVAHA
jgi:glycerol-3-phosphate O-acyltransferase